jgi:predicted O-linked N-acetylglucosamine transferase (SPINDLY family)
LKLGSALKDRRDYDDAIAAYRQALQIDAAFVPARYDLANALKHLGRLDEARRAYEAVLEARPDDPSTLICLGNVLKEQDHLPEAAGAYRKVLRQLPEQPLWDLWIATLCPSVFASADEIDEYRQRLLEDIRRVGTMDLRLKPPEVSDCGCPPPYNLQFHGRDDRPLKEAYANLFGRRIAGREPKRPSGRPRLGYLVTDGHEGVFIRYMWRVLEHLDRELCEQVILCSAGGEKRIRREISDEHIRTLILPSRFDRMLDVFEHEPFDVLYFWEVGSDVTNYFLPFFRPAAVQCTSAGVLETSGISQMNFYISSEWVEPDDADSHYAERLIRARTFLSCHARLEPPEQLRTREDFGFRKDEHLYVCAQKIRKFHPDFDPLLADILRSDPAGKVVIPEDQHGHFARKLRARFQRTIPDVVDRVTFLPYLPLPDYLGLLSASDVLLDPLNYGGGLSAYDAFSLDLPVVTLPGRFARGRYTTGMYRRMGVGDLIAESPYDYVAKAVAVACDRDYRQSLRERIRDASPLLFDDTAVVREYERIFELLIAEARR